jgi:uncharacterized membrane protein YoaK (UPF0700 family)
VTLVLVIVAATGIVDVACLLHLGAFTAYLTGSFILLGAGLVGGGGSVVAPLVAIVAFTVGAVGGRLSLRMGSASTRTPHVLAVDAVLVAVAAVVAGATGLEGALSQHVTVAVLAVAMGAQLAIVRERAVPGIALAAGTVPTYDLLAHLPLGRHQVGEGVGIRLGVLAGLLGGAMVGAALGRWEPWAAWAAAAVVLAGAAVLAQRLEQPGRHPTPPPTAG